MARKKTIAPVLPTVIPTPAPIAPPRMVVPEPPARWTSDELRIGINTALALVPFTGLNIAYTAAAFAALRGHLPGATVEVFFRGRELVIDARSGRAIARLSIPIPEET